MDAGLILEDGIVGSKIIGAWNFADMIKLMQGYFWVALDANENIMQMSILTDDNTA